MPPGESTQRIPGEFEPGKATPPVTQETAEEKQQPPDNMDTTQTSASSFKPPKLRIFTGEGDDRDAATLEAWITALKDYLQLSTVTDDARKLQVMQYFVSKTAGEFYDTTRLQTGITFDDMLERLKNHLIPTQ